MRTSEMTMSVTAVRRGLFGAFATCTLGGVAAATIAINAPHCVLTYFVGGFVAKGYCWVGAFKKALVPVTTGLILGSGIVMARPRDVSR